MQKKEKPAPPISLHHPLAQTEFKPPIGIILGVKGKDVYFIQCGTPKGLNGKGKFIGVVMGKQEDGGWVVEYPGVRSCRIKPGAVVEHSGFWNTDLGRRARKVMSNFLRSKGNGYVLQARHHNWMVHTGEMSIWSTPVNIMMSGERMALLPTVLFTAPAEKSAHPTAEALSEKYGTWGEVKKYPRSDWTYEVNNNDTVLGYWDWVAVQMEYAAGDKIDAPEGYKEEEVEGEMMFLKIGAVDSENMVSIIRGDGVVRVNIVSEGSPNAVKRMCVHLLAATSDGDNADEEDYWTSIRSVVTRISASAGIAMAIKAAKYSILNMRVAEDDNYREATELYYKLSLLSPEVLG